MPKQREDDVDNNMKNVVVVDLFTERHNVKLL